MQSLEKSQRMMWVVVNANDADDEVGRKARMRILDSNDCHKLKHKRNKL